MSGKTTCPRCGNALAVQGDAVALADICPRCLARELLDESGISHGVKSPPPASAAAVPPKLPEEASAGRPFGKYLTVQLLGSGGMGEVWKAWDTSLGRWVALKFLKGDQSDLPRFLREARTAAALAHPNIAAVYETGEADRKHYIAMQYVDGLTLAQYPRRDRKLLVRLMRDVARAVEHAHAQGIVHRDLKPGNLMVAGDRVYVLDFGLAKRVEGGEKLSLSGDVLGTPAYMSPEQARGEAADARSDVYGLGATLYELLSNRAPFSGRNLYDLLEKVQKEDPPSLRRLRPNFDRDLETIILKCLEKEPGRRYASARDFADDLDRFLAGEPIHAEPVTSWQRLAKWARRRPASAALAAVSTVAAVSLLVGGFWYNARLRTALALAEHQRLEAVREGDRAQEQESVARAQRSEALQQAEEARKERRSAQLALADSLIAQGDASGAAGSWERAKPCYEQSRRILEREGEWTFPAELGMWDALRSAPPPLMTFRGHEGRVLHLSVSRDGRLLLSAGTDQTIRIWDIRTGRLIRTIPNSMTHALAWLADARHFLATELRGQIVVRDAESGQVVRKIRPHRHDAISWLALSEDGKTAASMGCRCEAPIKVWEVDSGRVLSAITPPNAQDPVFGFNLSPDGRRVLVGRSGDLEIYDSETGRPVRTLSNQGNEVYSAVLTPDGTSLLVGTADPTIQVSDARSGRFIRMLHGHKGGVRSIAVTPDSRKALSGGWDNSVILWGLEDGKPLRRFEGHSDRVEAVALLPGGLQGISAGRDSLIHLWDLAGAREEHFAENRAGGVDSACFTPDGRLAMVGRQDGELWIWDVETWLPVGRIRLPAGACRGVSVTACGKKAVAVGQDGAWRLIDLTSGSEVRAVSTIQGAFRDVVCSPTDPSTALTTNDRGDIIAWDLETGQERRRFPVHVRGADALSFSPDGKRFLSAGNNEYVARLWDLDTGKEIRRYPGGGIVMTVAFAPDGLHGILPTGLNVVSLWDLEQGKPLREFRGHRTFVPASAVSPDGRFFVSGSADRTLRIWDLRKGTELKALVTDARRIQISSCGTRVLAVDLDRTLRVWDLGLARRYRDLENQLSVRLQGSENPQALAAVGEWYAFRHLWDWAVDFLEKAKAAGGRVSRLALARCYWYRGDIEAARREFAQALDDGEAPPSYIRACMAGVNLRTEPGALSGVFKAVPLEANRLQPGLMMRCYSDRLLQALVLTRKDGTISHQWGQGPAWPDGPSDGFSIRWTGYLKAPKSGRYTLRTASDDGVRVFLDGRQVLSNWSDHSLTVDLSSCDLEAGFHRLVVEYSESAGDAVLELGIEARIDGQRITLAEEHFFHDPLEPAAVATGGPSLPWPAPQPPTEGLIGHWTFEEGSGNDTADLSVRAANGSLLQGAAWARDGNRPAVRFASQGSNVQIPGFRHAGPAVTLSAWVRHDAITNGIQRYVSLRPEAAVLRHEGSGELNFYAKIDGTLHGVKAARKLSVGKWTHVAGTWDGATLRLYLDGQEIASREVPGILSGAHTAEIGSSIEPMQGSIADVRIYDRALTPAEVAGLIEEGEAVRPPFVRILTVQVGGKEGSYFDEWRTTGTLVGFRFTGGPSGGDVISSIQGLFREPDGSTTAGAVHGNLTGTPQEVVARAGYAVGGVQATGDTRLRGFKVVFMKLSQDGRALDPSDRYESEAYGKLAPSPGVTLGGDGSVVVGLRGRSGADVDALGLVLARPFREERPLVLREPDASPGLVQGLRYEYFEGFWDWLPDFGSLKPAGTGFTDRFETSPRKVEDGFGFRFTGFVEAPRDGLYRFTTLSDDGSKLYIGNRRVVANDGLHGPMEATGEIPLKAGKHSITATYFEKGGEQSFEVYWEGPGIPRQIIPPSSLFRSAGPAGESPIGVEADAKQRFDSAIRLLEARKFTEATDLFEKLAREFPRSSLGRSSAYNVACSHALTGDKAMALDWLEKAVEMGWKDVDHMEKDTDLDSLRGEERYRKLVERLKTQ